jgi:hypothetical protein
LTALSQRLASIDLARRSISSTSSPPPTPRTPPPHPHPAAPLADGLVRRQLQRLLGGEELHLWRRGRLLERRLPRRAARAPDGRARRGRREPAGVRAGHAAAHGGEPGEPRGTQRGDPERGTRQGEPRDGRPSEAEAKRSGQAKLGLVPRSAWARASEGPGPSEGLGEEQGDPPGPPRTGPGERPRPREQAAGPERSTEPRPPAPFYITALFWLPLSLFERDLLVLH